MVDLNIDINNKEEDKLNPLNNSTSSFKISSTMDKPDVKTLINGVATILQSQIIEDEKTKKKLDPCSDMFFFSEEKYILEKPDEFDEARIQLLRSAPSVENIFEFIKALFDCAQFSPECCVVSLVYINRIAAFAEMPLQTTNWRPLILCSLLVAQKMWDVKYLSNADFAFIYPFFTTKEINQLEKKFLEMLQYNVSVKSAIYAKYYFTLRELCKDKSKVQA
jgi:hypothetical protein